LSLPPQKGFARWLAERGGATLVLIALLVSAAMSYLLARSISRPIRRFRESANAIADGDLDSRVVASVGGRRDEIGLLAEDFDRMAAGLQRAWRRQSELTANVSHELRSPLARLRVALELARRKTGELAELDRIDAETERLDALIGQLLEFSRLDTAPDEEPVEVDLDELLRAVVDDVAFEFGDSCHIEVDTRAAATTKAYSDALRGAIENVLRNAAQHSPAGGAVQVTLYADDANAVVTISDSGGGVVDRELERVFEPFYRAGRNRTSNSGSGLGLAIAARAVDLNGGTISARNEGDGLSVEIRLPGQP
jgi:two-component system OmpR family sensor kinase